MALPGSPEVPSGVAAGRAAAAAAAADDSSGPPSSSARVVAAAGIQLVRRQASAAEGPLAAPDPDTSQSRVR